MLYDSVLKTNERKPKDARKGEKRVNRAPETVLWGEISNIILHGCPFKHFSLGFYSVAGNRTLMTLIQRI